MADIDPALLTASDVLVLEALTRAWSRTVPRSRRAVAPHARHTEYQRYPVPVDRMDSAMRDAWALCPILAHRHELPVDVVRWQEVLDQYTRALLMMGMEHTTARLIEVLRHVPDGDDDADEG